MLRSVSAISCMLLVAWQGAFGAVQSDQSTASPATASSGRETPSTNGVVSLTLNRSSYGADDSVLVTIVNGLTRSIWVADQRAGCSSVSIERSAHGAWTRVGNCAPPRVGPPVSIAPGASLLQRLFFAAGGFDTGAGWPAGLYRATLTYKMNSADGSGAALTIHSAEFTVSLEERRPPAR
jgi:hypothetical protein